MHNLQSWQKGTSGNPKGRPKGSRNIRNVIRDLLTDKNTYSKLPTNTPRGTETPLEAIVYTLMTKSIDGDTRASDVLLKYAVDKDVPPDEGGFFSQSELRITVVNDTDNPHANAVTETTGTVVVTAI